jgi:alcohol dehydrogenase class IV
VFRFTAASGPERHLEGAALLGADVRGAALADAGEVLGAALERLMRRTGIPQGLEAIGYVEADVDALVRGTIVQKRLLDNAPVAVAEPELAALFRGAMRLKSPA